MKGYTTKAAIENYLLTTIDESFSSQVESWIGAMEKYIDKLTGRNFIADEEASERVYDGEGTDKIFTDDFIELESIEIDGDVIEEDSDYPTYYLYPANEEYKNIIKLADQCAPKGNQNVKVSAKWGYSEECPDDIILATTILVAGIVNYSNNACGEIKTVSIGRYSVTYKDEKQWQDFERVKEIINGYKKYSF